MFILKSESNSHFSGCGSHADHGGLPPLAERSRSQPSGIVPFDSAQGTAKRRGPFQGISQGTLRMRSTPFPEVEFLGSHFLFASRPKTPALVSRSTRAPVGSSRPPIGRCRPTSPVSLGPSPVTCVGVSLAAARATRSGQDFWFAGPSGARRWGLIAALEPV